MSGSSQVRRLSADEGELLRELRLAALADAPDAFGETLEEALDRDPAWWKRLSESVTSPHACFIAELHEQPVGMVYGIVGEVPGEARIGGLWVATEARRQGVGRDLVAAVEVWALRIGRSELALWAPISSVAAVALYESTGFVSTGSRRRVREGMEIVEMKRPLPRG